MANEVNLRSDGSIDQTIVDLGKDWIAVTISGGTMTFTESMVTVAAESGSADDLVTIANGGTGKMLLIRPASGDKITIKHNTGNIWMSTGRDLLIEDAQTPTLLIYNGSKWVTVVTAGSGLAVVDPLDPDDLDPGETVECVSAALVRNYVKAIIDAAKAVIPAGGLLTIVNVIKPIIELATGPVTNPYPLLRLAQTLNNAPFGSAALIDGEFTTDAYDTLQCVIRAGDANNDGVYTIDEVDDMVTLLNALGTDYGDFFADVFVTLGPQGVDNARGTDIASASPIDCDVCDACDEMYQTWGSSGNIFPSGTTIQPNSSTTYNFSRYGAGATAGGHTGYMTALGVFNTGGAQDNAHYLRGTPGDNPSNGNDHNVSSCVAVLAAECTVTKVQFWGEQTGGNGSTFKGLYVYYLDASRSVLFTKDLSSSINSTWTQHTVADVVSGVKYVVIEMDGFLPGGILSKLDQIRINGA